MATRVDFDRIKRDVKCEQVALYHRVLMKSEGGGQFRGECPQCRSGGPRALSINNEKGFQCFSSKAKGDVISLHAHLLGLRGNSSMRDAAEDLTKIFKLYDITPRANPGDIETIKNLRDRFLNQATDEDSLPYQAAAAAELLMNIMRDMERP